jgi:hypothetical protein
VSYDNLPPSVLWRNRQTEARLILKSKLRNHHSDFEVKLEKTITTGFEAKPAKTIAAGFEGKPIETVATSFEA